MDIIHDKHGKTHLYMLARILLTSRPCYTLRTQRSVPEPRERGTVTTQECHYWNGNFSKCLGAALALKRLEAFARLESLKKTWEKKKKIITALGRLPVTFWKVCTGKQICAFYDNYCYYDLFNKELINTKYRKESLREKGDSPSHWIHTATKSHPWG